MKCPVCEGETELLFTLPIMKKYEGKYHQCTSCETLAVQNPHWLDEAYGDSHLTTLDVGALHRGLQTWAGTRLIMDIWGHTEALDWGTGDGLLPRFLRDQGLNAYGEDKWSPRTHCRAFDPPQGWKPQIVTAYEVWEHWVNPREELSKIMEMDPEVHLFSTCPWMNQGQNWSYLAPSEGQHIVFYSQKGLLHMAKINNRAIFALGRNMFIMFKDTQANRLKAHIASSMWTGWRWESLRATILNAPVPGLWKDEATLIERFSQR